VFIGVRDEHKQSVVPIARSLQGLGYRLLATPGTRRVLLAAGLEQVEEVSLQADAPNNLFLHMASGALTLVINTTKPGKRRIDPTHLRRMVLTHNIAYCTTIEAARTLVGALETTGRERDFVYLPLRGYGDAPPAAGPPAVAEAP
jgi:carbamoyl-phosphate synthase large subunit